MNAAQNAGVVCRLQCDVTRLEKNADEFHLSLANGETLAADAVLLAVGGTRTASAGKLAAELERADRGRLIGAVSFILICH